MFRAKTVLVIGAGASAEVGLPMGPELLKKIVELTHITFDFDRQKTGDNYICEALRLCLNEGREVTKINEHLEAGWQLGESAKQALSIDNVIEALEDSRIELVAKLGIARSILKAEESSLVYNRIEKTNETIDLSIFSENWYGSFTKLLTENVRKSQLKNIFQNIEIINFNYDRCIEHYLPISLSSYYGTKPDVIREIMQDLTIHRPYGVAGRLPWQKGNAPSVAFGQSSPRQLADVAQQIRTFTERVEEKSELAAMKDTIANADRVVFLGFAFHRQNIELLAQAMQDHTEIVATAYKISESDKAIIKNELARAFDHKLMIHDSRIELADMKCDQFFKEYWRTLTAEKGDHVPHEESIIPPHTPYFPSYSQFDQ